MLQLAPRFDFLEDGLISCSILFSLLVLPWLNSATYLGENAVEAIAAYPPHFGDLFVLRFVFQCRVVMKNIVDIFTSTLLYDTLGIFFNLSIFLL